MPYDKCVCGKSKQVAYKKCFTCNKLPDKKINKCECLYKKDNCYICSDIGKDKETKIIEDQKKEIQELKTEIFGLNRCIKMYELRRDDLKQSAIRNNSTFIKQKPLYESHLSVRNDLLRELQNKEEINNKNLCSDCNSIRAKCSLNCFNCSPKGKETRDNKLKHSHYRDLVFSNKMIEIPKINNICLWCLSSKEYEYKYGNCKYDNYNIFNDKYCNYCELRKINIDNKINDLKLLFKNIKNYPNLFKIDNKFIQKPFIEKYYNDYIIYEEKEDKRLVPKEINNKIENIIKNRLNIFLTLNRKLPHLLTDYITSFISPIKFY